MLASYLMSLLCFGPAPDLEPDEPAATPVEAEASAEPTGEPSWSPPREEPSAPSTPSSSNDVAQPFEPTPSHEEARAAAPAAPAVAVVGQTRVRPDRPIRYRIDLQIDGGTHNVGHRSFQAYALGRNLPGLSAGVRVDFRLAESRVFLGAGLAYRRYASSRLIYDVSIDQELLVQEPLVFLRASFAALEGLDVYLEPGGGPTIVDVETFSSRSAEQRGVTGMFNGLAGVALYLPKAWLPNKGASRVTGGFDLGLGYGWRAPIAVAPTPSTDDEPLRTSSVRFGDLALRGFIWRAGLFIRFM